ncbi:hypothetical protein, partial [Klebsiella oxytoca]|uniref:hypothetical protein n=1 Tax=Klebsiella oxytoca TaxID=571 RepID=UPI001CA31A8E
NSFTILVNAVNSKHIFSKIDTDCGDGHNESLWVNVYPMIARKLIRHISRGSPFHSLSLFFELAWRAAMSEV